MELTTRTFSQFIELCLPRFGFPNINGNRRYPVRGETIDNEFEISSEHEKVYINILFSISMEFSNVEILFCCRTFYSVQQDILG